MLAIDNLHVSYGQSEVIHGVSLDVAPGEIVAIMGRNGMGKTTLMKSLMGIVPSRSGTISVQGKGVEGSESFERVKSGLS